MLPTADQHQLEIDAKVKLQQDRRKTQEEEAKKTEITPAVIKDRR